MLAFLYHGDKKCDLLMLTLGLLPFTFHCISRIVFINGNIKEHYAIQFNEHLCDLVIDSKICQFF